MTERERWIVYPLLFLALGAALRDKLSEQTNTKLIRCQELVVTGEEVAGQEGATLVRIGAVPRTSANSPHLGEIVVTGRIQTQVVQADGIVAQEIDAARVNAENYFFHRIPLAPVTRSVPGVSPADQLRRKQMQEAEAKKAKAQNAKTQDADAGADNPGTANPPKAVDDTAPAGVE
jgi:hypothetical protein